MMKTKMPSLKNLVSASVCSYLGALSFGYVIGFSSPALPLMQLAKEPMYKNPDAASWFGSIVTLGAMFGCPIAGWLVERFGRRITLIFTSLPFMCGWIAISFGDSLQTLYLGRVLTGFASGMVCVVSPLYIAEISTKELRGMLGSGVQLFITIGILTVYALGLAVSWRGLAFIGATFPMLACLLTWFAPESPRYLLNSNQKNEALRSLLWLRGTSAVAEDECRDMEENTDADEKFSWSEFRKPELFRPLTVSVMIMIFQQLSGINVIMFYSVSICQSAGFNYASGIASVIIGAVQVVGTVVACFCMDRAGRRYLLIVAGLGMALSCFMLGTYYHINIPLPKTEDLSTVLPLVSESTHDLSWLALVSLVGYVLAFALGWGPIPMLLMSEIFPARARGAASAAASLTNWIMAFMITKEFALLQTLLGMDGTFCLFGISCFVAVVYVWYWVPETKGRSLEDIELYFLGRAIRGI